MLLFVLLHQTRASLDTHPGARNTFRTGGICFTEERGDDELAIRGGGSSSLGGGVIDALGCGYDLHDAESAGVLSQALNNGFDDDGDPPLFGGVVALCADPDQWGCRGCTAWAITERTLITSAHCFVPESTGCGGIDPYEPLHYVYRQPAVASGDIRSPRRIRVTPAGSNSLLDGADPDCPSYPTYPGWPQESCDYGVEAIAIHPDVHLSVDECVARA